MMVIIHLILKRIFDLIFSILGMIVLLPIFIIIGIIVKFDSKGPIFFKQNRIGLNGKFFKIIKFRSMIEGAEFIGTGIFNYEDDPRETKIGKFLRNYSLDELPQIYNIFLGDMSFVGPRPPVTYELGNFEDFNAELKKRFTMKPGVTGYAQIKGRNNLNWDQKIHFDNQYIDDFKKWGILLDIKILIITFYKILVKEGNYELLENAKKDRARLNKTE